jgi:hypothetical protein
MKKPSRGCLWTLGVLCTAVLAVLVFDKIVPSKAVRDLPTGATDIQEYYEDFGITGDFTRVLKARIPREQVQAYALRVGAPNQEQGKAGKDYVSWAGGPDWWSPKEPPLYFHYEQGYRILVGWEDGFVYSATFRRKKEREQAAS